MTILNEKGQRVYSSDFATCSNDTFDGLADFFVEHGIDCEKYYCIGDAIKDALVDTEELGELLKRIPDITLCTLDSLFLHVLNQDKWYAFNEYNSYSEDDLVKSCEKVLKDYFPGYKIVKD